MQNVFFPLLNAFSTLTNLVKFGNFSVVHLVRIAAAETPHGKVA